MQVGFTYSWSLPAGDFPQVRDIIDKLRQYAVEHGGEVGDVKVLTGDEAQAMQPKARHAVMFAATIPGATAAEYGLASAGSTSWSWSGAVLVSDVRSVSEFHAAGADLGLEVVEGYGGMVFTSKKNAAGAVVTVQRSVYDWTDF